ncbi:MAG: HDOD domain-containing protein [Deltaproteobacteria bacterium]|nr:HDOD domain-containing protein [Deltaproteobacteria bacterium]
MNKLNGTLSTTSLPEILHLCSVQQKTGTLVLTRSGINKKLYFNKGELIYITSNKMGERVGEYLIQRGELTRTWAGFLLKDSQRTGIAFTSSLLKKNIFEKDKLEAALSDLANTALADVMTWTAGSYEFSSKIPQQALDGPIRISEAKALQQIIQQGGATKESNNTDELLRTLARKIVTDSFSLPLLPTIAIKLQEHWSHSKIETEPILKLVREDQVLSAYVLRVINSALGKDQQRCATIKQALAAYSADHLIGIVHAQMACAQPPKQSDTVSQLLQHALRCAYLSEQIATQLGEDQEMAFTCGLFHNIGKILLLQLLTENNIADEKLPQLVAKFHQNCGALLSRRWNLAPQVHNCIKSYHDPHSAKENQQLVEIIYLSHKLLVQPDTIDDAIAQCTHLKTQNIKVTDLTDNLALIDEVVASIYTYIID